jgi:type IV pilus assembly protein PilQ
MMTDHRTHQNLVAVMVVAAVLALVAAGCVSPNTAQVTKAESGKQIVDIVTTEDAGNLFVVLKGSGQLTYTALKQDTPLGVVFHFPATALDNLREVYHLPENDTISTIRASEQEEKGLRAARVFIALKREAAYELKPEGQDLKIVFPKAGPPVAKAAPIKEADLPRAPAPAPPPPSAKAATELKGVSAAPAKDAAVITLVADGAVKNYKSFTMEEPPARIVFDLPGLRSPFKVEQKTAVPSGPVSRLRHFAYPDKVRLVIETQKAYLAKYTAEPSDTGLVIHVGEPVKTPAGDLKLASGPAPAPAAAKPVVSSGAPALVNRVEFASEDVGRSAVIIGTTRPAEYELVKAGEKEVLLKLLNTSVPEHHRRPLISTRFESAVDRVTPTQGKGVTVVSVALRENVPYTAERVGNVIRVDFEASTIPPKPYEDARVPAWKEGTAPGKKGQESPDYKSDLSAPGSSGKRKVSGGTTADNVTLVMEGREVKAEGRGEDWYDLDRQRKLDQHKGVKERVDYYVDQKARLYTGEKIALDFYDTDIKNVFRVLKEVSGKNFAVDKNVTGKVTLTIDKPVPWDQILDVVLKMNQLDRTYEGDIIRIATIPTLEMEEKLKKANLEELRKKRLFEEKITVFIPLNYANAQKVDADHVKPLLTKDAVGSTVIGTSTVEARTNTIIVTDLAEPIKRIKEVLSRIDAVTPQVLIEARVVEATSDFSREIGFDWGTISVEAFKIGAKLNAGPTTFTANNIPNTYKTDNTIGFNFSTLFGTGISIVDAKLTASEAEGKTTVISAPKVITLNGKEAKIKQGLEVPYLERDSSGNATVKFKPIDLELIVKPNVSLDNRVTMEIQVKKDEAVDPTAPEPAILTNEAKTEILVDDGETIVIGGILKDSKKLSNQGIPGLRNLPGLGWMFRSDKVENKKNELLIFLTPRIIQLEQHPAAGRDSKNDRRQAYER